MPGREARGRESLVKEMQVDFRGLSEDVQKGFGTLLELIKYTFLLRCI
jgi:hypothetical protein